MTMMDCNGKMRPKSEKPPPPPIKPTGISTIRLKRPDTSILQDRMSDRGHLRQEQIERAQEIARRLIIKFSPDGNERGALMAIDRASGRALKQSTMSTLLSVGQCGYKLAQELSAFAHVQIGTPLGYILEGSEDVGTAGARKYALMPMKYRAKGEILDALARTLPGEFLDFTALRDPDDPAASSWSGSDWLQHLSREMIIWNELKSKRKPR